METEEALAGEYVAAMLAAVAVWIVLTIGGVVVGGYLALEKLGL